MKNYSKLIGSIVGVIVAVLLAWGATAFPAFVSCTDSSDVSTCLIFGKLSQSELTAWLMAILTPILVERFPANDPG